MSPRKLSVRYRKKPEIPSLAAYLWSNVSYQIADSDFDFENVFVWCTFEKHDFATWVIYRKTFLAKTDFQQKIEESFNSMQFFDELQIIWGDMNVEILKK